MNDQRRFSFENEKNNTSYSCPEVNFGMNPRKLPSISSEREKKQIERIASDGFLFLDIVMFLITNTHFLKAGLWCFFKAFRALKLIRQGRHVSAFKMKQTGSEKNFLQIL